MNSASSTRELNGQFLSLNPLIAEQLLLQLNAMDLNRCACVCKLWNQIAKNIKIKRSSLLWMFQVVYQDTGLIPDSRNDDHVNSASWYACHSTFGIGKHFYEMLNNSPIQPQTGIIFCSTNIFYDPQQYFSNFKNVDKDDPHFSTFFYDNHFMQYLATDLPRNCHMICCEAPGIIGMPVDNSIPSEIEQLDAFSSLMFPNILGVDIHPFSVPKEYSWLEQSEIHAKEIAKITGISENANVKCMLLFCEYLPHKTGITRTIVEHYMNKQDMKIAVGGAIVNSVIAPIGEREECLKSSGVIFTGEKLNASSIVIFPSVRSVNALEAKLVEFKAGSRLGKTSVAFMFADCDRGSKHYKESNLEAKTFRKVFPGTLLLGCFCNGGIGITYLPNATFSTGKVFKDETNSQPTLVHGYTTIFVLLSW